MHKPSQGIDRRQHAVRKSRDIPPETTYPCRLDVKTTHIFLLEILWAQHDAPSRHDLAARELLSGRSFDCRPVLVEEAQDPARHSLAELETIAQHLDPDMALHPLVVVAQPNEAQTCIYGSMKRWRSGKMSDMVVSKGAAMEPTADM